MLYSSWNKGAFYIIVFIVIVFTYCRETSQCYNGSYCWSSTVFCKLIWYSIITRWNLVWGHLNKMGLRYKHQGVWMWVESSFLVFLLLHEWN